MLLKVAEIGQLWVYPITSCKGIAVQEAPLTALGLEYDRCFVVVDARTGIAFSQNECPRLCLVQPEIGNGTLSLSAPGMHGTSVPLGGYLGEESRVIMVHDEQCSGWDVGDSAAGWFSQFLDRECRLMAHRERVCRSDYFTLKREFAMSFAWKYPLLGISEESLHKLNKHIVDGGGTAVPMNRFRPNIVFKLEEGEPPNAETSSSWDDLFIGERGNVYLKPGPLCLRGGVTLVNQETGSKDIAGEPLRTLRKFYRLSLSQDNPLFGRYFMGKSEKEGSSAILHVGDAVALFRT